MLEGLEPLVVLTGAGISAESGIPTFRGQDGLWNDHRAQDLATPTAFAEDPELVWRFYDWRRQLVSRCGPNPAHNLLAELERALPDFTLITQNVDGLHHQAGSQSIIELHGSLWWLRCPACRERWQDRSVPLGELPPRCQSCGSIARPDVVWFGEILDSKKLESAVDAAASCSTMLVIGTSAVVQPAASLANYAKAAGARVLEFNLESTPLSGLADETWRGPASAQLARWWAEVRGGGRRAISG